MTMAEEYEALGLYDPGAPDATDRLALLEYFESRGITSAQMIDANRRGHLVPLAADLILRGDGERLTREQAAEAAGISPALIDRAWLAAGFPVAEPEARAFSAADVEVLRIFSLAASMFGEDALLQFSRVLGSSLARIAEAANTMFLVNVEESIHERRAGEAALARANVDAVQAMLLLPTVMTSLFLRHADLVNVRVRETQSAASIDSTDLAVAFVDLVGFTSLSERLGGRELGMALAQFEARASDLVVANSARLVKLIGDEVMFVAPDAATACAIALELVRFVADHPVLTAARGAIAAGDVVSRDGDYFGPVVNLAARAAARAEPGQIVVSDAVRRRVAPERFAFTPTGRHQLKGISEPVDLYAVGSDLPSPQH